MFGLKFWTANPMLLITGQKCFAPKTQVLYVLSTTICVSADQI